MENFRAWHRGEAVIQTQRCAVTLASRVKIRQWHRPHRNTKHSVVGITSFSLLKIFQYSTSRDGPAVYWEKYTTQVLVLSDFSQFYIAKTAETGSFALANLAAFTNFFFLQFNLEEKPRVYSLGGKKKRKKIKNLVLICITPNLSNATIHYSSLPCCSVGIYISKHISISHCRKLNKPGTTSAAFQPLAFYELQMQRFNSKLGVYLWSDSM